MPRLSIVLPVYNVERYLATCLDSLRSQTLRDIEIICVNDGSTDRSATILQMAAEVDDRIVVVTKPNGGLSSARNAGLHASNGELVLFVDSDDYLHKTACQTIVKAFDRTDAEIVTFGAYIHPVASGTRWLHRTLSPRRVTYTGFDPDLMFKEASRPFVWRSAFTRAFLDREALEFDETVAFGEDQVFYFEAYPVSRKTALIPDKLYYYRVSRPDSLMASRFENRAAMMKEHHHITRIILEHWQERGWLADHRPRMLEWVLDFLAEDAVRSKGKNVLRLRRSLASLLLEFFPDGPWLEQASPTARRLLDALTQNGRGAGNAALFAAHLAWQVTAEPKSTARRIAKSAVHSWPMQKARGVTSRIFPASGRTSWIRLRDLSDDITDETKRSAALQMLQLEWAAAVAQGTGATEPTDVIEFAGTSGLAETLEVVEEPSHTS
ncbi:glycosyltransferase family 2 protein [Propioniciclava coleopterorum]|uniref:glycosyltransferase family 2 protein n=1 Tax=Propioniciclava coleopterorum TaxID=2714937 RepID=UPI001981C38C|nr:glycosyltransferase family 2 protein [Propioniciclava coleopterorum]